jgi:glyoxylase-like metal-dependent hydrolase (beta-lactamase superfamily II)
VNKEGESRLYILDLGYQETDLASLTGVVPTTSDDRVHASQWVKVPTRAFVVRHPQAGWVLFDTGCHPRGMDGHWPKGLRRHAPYHGTPDQTLAAQLQLISLNPSEVDWVVVSHLHFDHAGNIALFANTKAGSRVLLHEREFAEALVKTHQGLKRYAAGYVEADFILDGIKYQLLDGSRELAPGLEILELPGHSAGQLGLKVRLESTGTVIITSDAAYTRWNLSNPDRVPPSCFDSVAYRKTVKRLVDWSQHDSHFLFLNHDIEQASEYRYAPAFYS